TFQDVANGADHLASIAEDYALDLSRVVFMGHSAGGQLAIWLAARSQIPVNTAVSSENPQSALGVLALTPAPDLQGLHEQQVCGDVVDKLMGGSPAEFPDRYRLGDPMQISPGDVPQVLVVGAHDTDWAPAGLRYFRAATARGDNVRLIEAKDSGHFEVIDPESNSWPVVLAAALSLFEVD
ncbi:MAG: alpha/beta hydrolase, partial [Woeseiaceae bacterium]